MGTVKLLEIRPGQGLEQGISPSVEPSAGPLWRDATNAWFREGSIEHTRGRRKIVSALSRQPRVLAQAFTQAGHRRLYYEDGGLIFYWELGNQPVFIGSGGEHLHFEPWGDWLLVASETEPLRLWKNDGTLDVIATAEEQFKTAKIVRRLAQHVIAYGTDVLPSGFHWSSANDPENWTPEPFNSARNLVIRGADSEIVAVTELGPRHAVYFRDSMLLLQYVGPTQWFGTPNQAIRGIGAIHKHAVVSVGVTNFGLSRDGVWGTDGNSAAYLDRPAIDTWLQENVDWARAQEEVDGFWDARHGLVTWTLPINGGEERTLCYDPKGKSFTIQSAPFGVGMHREVFDYPIVSMPDGLYEAGVEGTTSPEGFRLSTHMFHANEPENFKSWDYMLAQGTFTAHCKVRFGFADVPQPEALVWTDWVPMGTSVPFGPRESVYMAFELHCPTVFKLSVLSLWGEKGGRVT